MHRVIKHVAMCAFWRCFFKDTDEVSWEKFWKLFPSELIETSPDLGEVVVCDLEAFLGKPDARLAFKVSTHAVWLAGGERLMGKSGGRPWEGLVGEQLG